jgi:redox-sensitive bicupin YhaK (pirin superfamily)
MSVKSPVYTRTPTMYLDFTLKPNSPVFTQPIPQGWNAFAYILSGQGEFGSKKTPADAHHVLILSKNGEGFDFRNTSDKTDCRFVLIAGQPLNEPIVQRGPFVMNTNEGKHRFFVFIKIIFFPFRNSTSY